MFRDPLVNVYVRDVERVSRFYVDLLGFRETVRTPDSGPPDQVELRLEGLTLGFANVDATYARLLANGARSVSSPHELLGRLRVAWAADPEGSHVQIVMELTTAAG